MYDGAHRRAVIKRARRKSLLNLEADRVSSVVRQTSEPPPPLEEETARHRQPTQQQAETQQRSINNSTRKDVCVRVRVKEATSTRRSTSSPSRYNTPPSHVDIVFL